MAKLVLGLGTSQSPLVTVTADHWADHAANDRKKTDLCRADGAIASYEALEAEAGGKFAALATPEVFSKLFAASQRAVSRLAEDLSNADPDVLVVIGDDHAELFDAGVMPVLALYSGARLANDRGQLPADAAQWQRDRHNVSIVEPGRNYPGAPDFAAELIERLVEKEIDVAAVSEPAGPSKGIGHAWAFVVNRLLSGRDIPILPVILNSINPPNIPTPARCYRIGQALRAAIEESPRDLRVAVIVSGGLSHYVVNEALDRQVMAALAANDAETLVNLPQAALRMGSGEIRDWLVMAGVMTGLKLQWSEYLPAYRTPAGTGTGLAFASWA